MKKIVGYVVFLLSLVICCLSFCSCKFIEQIFDGSVSAWIDEDCKYLTTDATEDELRQRLTVFYDVKITDSWGISRILDDYELSYTPEEGYCDVTISYNDSKTSVEVLFVDKTKLSLEGDFLFCEIKGNDYLIEYRGNEKNLVLPERDPYILIDKLFSGNKTIESVVLGDSVKQIGSAAFAHTDIKSIEIGKSLTSICTGAFSACAQLEYLNVSSVEQWCGMIFNDRIPLRKIEVSIQPGGSISGGVIGEVVVVFPSGSDTIEQGFIPLYNVMFETSDFIVEDGFVHFMDENGNIVNSMALSISNPVYFTGSVHVNGTKIEHLVIPESVTKVSSGFANSDIKSVSIHKNVISIENMAFAGCNSLDAINVEDVNEALLNRYAKMLDQSSKAVNEYGGCRYIGNSANPYMILIGVSDENATEITTHSDTKAVASAVCIDKGAIEKLVLSDSVEYVGEKAVVTYSKTFTFVGGSNLRYIGKQKWFKIGSGMANVEIGDLSQWYFVDEDGQKVYLSSNSTYINEEGIKDTIYRD